MKKNVKSLLSVLGLVAFIIVAAPLEVNSQSPTPCEDEVVAVSGTKMNQSPLNPWVYECMGEFANCTDVFVLGCPEQQ